MKRLYALSLALVCASNANAQDRTDYPEYQRRKMSVYMYVAPYAGLSIHSSSTEQSPWQEGQVNYPSGPTEWSYEDNYELTYAPASYEIDPALFFGIEGGWVFDNSAKGNGKIRIGIGVEHITRNYRSEQSYYNGLVTGFNKFEGKESKLVIRPTFKFSQGKFGFFIGPWLRFSRLNERTVNFEAYQGGQLTYEEELMNESAPGYSSMYDWKNLTLNVGVEFGVTFRPTKYVEIFAKYSNNYISTTYRDYLIADDFLRNGMRVHSIYLGVAVPFDFGGN